MSEDRLLKENRRLKEENRSLKKLIKKLAKGNRRLEDLEEIVKDYSSEEAEEIFSNKCHKCKNGTLKTTHLGDVRTIIACDSCSHREVQKHGRERSKT